MKRQPMAQVAIPTWLPFVAKAVGTIYLLDAPAILVLRLIVLMFVPSKIEWTETFHGIPMRTWGVVLATAALTHLASGVVGWVMGVWLAHRRPGVLRHWRRFVGWLLVQHLAWSIWIVLAFQGETRYLLFTLSQGVLLVALALVSWFGPALTKRNDEAEQAETVIRLTPKD